MNKIHCKASIVIKVNQENFKQFVLKTTNLTQWTSFFVHFVSEENNRCRFETKMGITETWVDLQVYPDRQTYSINSLINGNHEFATLEVMLKKKGLKVQFHVYLNSNLSDYQVQMQKFIMKIELAKLKKCLEIPHE